MTKNAILIAFLFLAAVAAACTSATAPGGTNSSNANSMTNVPPEFSGTPIVNGASTPGIPPANAANMTNLPKGTTPTPGIPDPSTIGKTPMPKGTPPIPGIPDEKTLKEQMKRVITDANLVNQAPKTVQEAANSKVKTVKKQ